METSLYKRKHVGAIFKDLSKVFVTINHDLFIAKLADCAFSHKSSDFILSYLKKYSRVNVNNAFSSWEEIVARIPQGSLPGPLLFDI